MTPGEHDEICAFVSHLPHILANVFLQTVCMVREDIARFGGPSFQDMTRVAGSSPSVWVDIFLTNKKLLRAAREFLQNFEHFLSLLEEGRETEVLAFLQEMARLKERTRHGS
uniref:Prephenate dehydrogenase n=1 Tax=Candidatus Caldatribacterium californiense TaxID=1454726 RepID=A0A7V4DF25_9BACT